MFLGHLHQTTIAMPAAIESALAYLRHTDFSQMDTGRYLIDGEKVFALVPVLEKAMNTKITKEVSPEKRKAYTTVGGAPFLDDQYTVFGKIIKGFDIIDKIAMLHADNTNRPVEDFAMTISVEEMSKSRITKEYGYIYPKKN